MPAPPAGAPDTVGGSGSGFGSTPGAVHALGVDVGSTNTKVALIAIDPVGTVRELALHSVPTCDDVPALLQAVESGIRQVLTGTHPVPRVVGIASMAETGVPLGADDVPLTPLLRWNGARGSRDSDDLVERFGAAALFAATGVPTAPKAPLCTWRWLARTQPVVFGRMSRWAGASDLVCLALTGELVTDHTLAARTMAYRLPRPDEPLPTEFDAPLLAAATLDPARLPAVSQPGRAAGSVTAAAAGRTTLAAGTPVVIAGHDHAVGAWAAGVRAPGDAADSLGTAEALVRVLGSDGGGDGGGDGIDREAVRRAGMSLGRTVTGAHETLIAGMAGAGSLVRWWFDHLLGGADAGALFAQVDACAAVPGDLLVLPYLAGRQSPEPDLAARLQILNRRGEPVDPASRGPAELTKGLLEGLSLQLRWMDAEQRRLTGRATAGIRVLGGVAADNRTWLRIKAAVLPAPLSLLRAAEPVACGAALLAAVRLGLTGDDAALAHTGACSAATGAGADYDDAYRDFVAAATR